MNVRLAIAVILAALVAPAIGAGDALPMRLQDPRSGNMVSVEAGDTVLHVVFFATWCPECRDEMDRLSRLEVRWSGRGYRLLLVAVATRHSADRLAVFAEQNETPGRLLFDADGSHEQSLKIDALPTHLLFDGNGREQFRSESVGRIEQELNRRFEDGAGGR